MSQATSDNSSSRSIFIASFLTIFAAGVGFGVRGVILGDWADKFGFTKTDLGTITGGGLTGFGIVIILSSLILDKVGYKKILMCAFVLHVLSAIVTLSATPIFNAAGREATFQCLFWGMFLFAIGNGLCEAAVNPLVATLYPRQKTHYLNILHASWPAGLVGGSLFAYFFAGANAKMKHLPWEVSMGMFLVPVLIYGLMLLPKKLPQSEASAAGVSVGQMLAQFASPILLLLLLIHAMVGYVELGTDSWIQNIMDNVVKENAILLFIFTSALMFVLRFFAGPIVERINPLGLLCISGILGFVGLMLLSKAESVGAAFLAGGVYALGKTFLWPTMLGVAGERFPRGGAIVMGVMGGIGMLSAGEIGTPMIGYEQDYYASDDLKTKAPEAFNRYVSPEKNKKFFFPEISGLDGTKVSVLKDDPKDDGKELEADYKLVLEKNRTDAGAEEIKKRHTWWIDQGKPHVAQDRGPVIAAKIHGGREALRLTSFIPLTMAGLYLLLVLYFRATGGYKQVEIHHQAEGPMSEL
ncbi:MAG: MFS transporter [Pirellula sp.]|nr:MFS transporter [Pirellula sp.]